MRKTALKKQNPDRHKYLMKLRDMGEEATTVITTRNGAEVRLNLWKHLLMGKPYKNEEYNSELLRLHRKVMQSKIPQEGGNQ